VETSAISKKVSRRFVAGETLQDALAAARRITAEGLLVTLDHLGENVTSLAEAAASASECVDAVHALHRAGLEPNVSIKLTQFGLDFDGKACLENVARLAAAARQCNGFVRIDMESAEYTARTLCLAADLFAEYGCVGTVIQAYLRRSRQDVEFLNRRGIRVRLCKGAYLEPAEVAFQEKAEVNRSYVELMKELLDHGVYPALATHDERIVNEALRYAAQRGIPPGRFEFQMLYGIRRDLQRKLIREGYRVRLYVPYGQAWYPYFMRRLAERPANVIFLARNLLR
jgi:proline dehydrogenase